jgi:CheY-like chemotaxis protein
MDTNGISMSKTLKILLVEDDEVSQKALIQILDNLNINYDLALNGLEAFNLSKSNNYDMIFMDISIPEIDGLTVSKNIRDNGFKNPIIIISGDNVESKNTYYAIDEFLLKPIKLNDIKLLIENFFTEKDINHTKETDVLLPAEFKDDQDLFLELLEVFLRDVNVKIISIEDSLNYYDWDYIQREVHSIKGSASYVNAVDILNIATQIDSKLKNNDYDDIALKIKSLKLFIKEFNERALIYIEKNK